MVSPIPDDDDEEEEEESVEQLEDNVVDETIASTGSPKRKAVRKRDGSTLRKAPQAPKRFKSSYICFFMAQQTVIKDELGDKATVTEISKRSAEMWRNLSAEDRAHWEDVAAKDKQRYMVEKATYTGPWQVPWKRAKKDPSAPKRPMSAFLYYSQEKRKQIKEINPDMKNTEVSRLLGEMWRNASEDERRPHIEMEKEEREKYKVEIASWRKDFDAKMEAQRQAQLEQSQIMACTAYGGEQQLQQSSNAVFQSPPPPAAATMPFESSPAPPPVPTPTSHGGGYGYPGYYPYGPSPYCYPPSSSSSSSNRHHVILGPDGRPRYQHPYPMQTPPPPLQQQLQQQQQPQQLYPSMFSPPPQQQEQFNPMQEPMPAASVPFEYIPDTLYGQDGQLPE